MTALAQDIDEIQIIGLENAICFADTDLAGMQPGGVAAFTEVMGAEELRGMVVCLHRQVIEKQAQVDSMGGLSRAQLEGIRVLTAEVRKTRMENERLTEENRKNANWRDMHQVQVERNELTQAASQKAISKAFALADDMRRESQRNREALHRWRLFATICFGLAVVMAISQCGGGK